MNPWVMIALVFPLVLVALSGCFSRNQAEVEDSPSHLQTRFDCTDLVEGGATPGRSRSAAFMDYDIDGDLDIIHGETGQTAILLENLGDGSFREVPLDFEAFGLAVGNYNLDDYPDIYLSQAGIVGPLPDVLLENRAGRFVDVTNGAGLGDAEAGWAARFWDYDGDGYLDIFVANYDGPNLLYHNNRDGTFTNVAPQAGVEDPIDAQDAVWADYDNDHDPDLFVTGGFGFGTGTLYRNDGDGTFTDVTLEAGIDPDHGGLGAVFADFNNDGLMDLYVTFWNELFIETDLIPLEMRSQHEQTYYDIDTRRLLRNEEYAPGIANRLYINMGDGAFRRAYDTGLEYIGGSISVTTGDFDNDGLLDLYLATGGPLFEEEDRLYRNSGDGTFVDVTIQARIRQVAQGHGVITGDYNRDGRLDIYVASGAMFESHASANVMCKNVGRLGNWLDVELPLKGQAIQGALVTVVAGETTQLRQVGGGAGFGSRNSPIAHFGLGTATVVDSVKVRWPDGTEQVVANVPGNQTITVTKSGGP